MQFHGTIVNPLLGGAVRLEQTEMFFGALLLSVPPVMVVEELKRINIHPVDRIPLLLHSRNDVVEELALGGLREEDRPRALRGPRAPRVVGRIPAMMLWKNLRWEDYRIRLQHTIAQEGAIACLRTVKKFFLTDRN